MLKHHNKLLNHRVAITYGIIFVSFCIILIRCFFLQIVGYQKNVQFAQNNYLKNIPIVPIRGNIYAVNNYPLAINEIVYHVFLNKNTKVTDTLVQQINFLFKTNFSKKYLVNLQSTKTSPVSANHTLITLHKLPSLPSDLIDKLTIKKTFLRSYPNKNNTAHLIGYIKDNAGILGLEKAYNTLLQGINGNKEIIVNATGKIIHEKITQQPKNGANLYLTINPLLQNYTVSQLKNQIGSIIILNATTGAIVTMYSNPTYNNNWFVPYITQSNYAKLTSGMQYSLYNTTTTSQYQIGTILTNILQFSNINMLSPTLQKKFFEYLGFNTKVNFVLPNALNMLDLKNPRYSTITNLGLATAMERLISNTPVTPHVLNYYTLDQKTIYKTYPAILPASIYHQNIVSIRFLLKMSPLHALQYQNSSHEFFVGYTVVKNIKYIVSISLINNFLNINTLAAAIYQGVQYYE